MLVEDIDLEDLEARLYGQVFHGDVEVETEPLPSTSINIELPRQVTSYAINNTQQKKSNRYFQQTNSPKSNLPDVTIIENNLPESNISSTHTKAKTNLSKTRAHVQEFINKITVNQYTYSPVVFDPQTALPPHKFFTSWAAENQVYQNSKKSKTALRKMRKKERQKAKKALLQQTKNPTPRKPNSKKADEIICLSDTDDDDCVEVKKLQNKEAKVLIEYPSTTTKEKDRESSDDEENDIIYIEPPPIPCINVDPESENEENVEENHLEISVGSSHSNTSLNTQGKSTVCLKNNYNPIERNELLNTPESSASNDFLDPSTVEGNNTHKFNFNLYGTDFDNTNFVRPANPTDIYETESSCSTSDFNKDSSREFNNSVKTVVFKEVEFPKEDIFLDNNLESFGSFITPKRNKAKSSSKETEKACKVTRQVQDDSSSSESSSESDYETNTPKTKNQRNVPGDNPKKLPTLSPMLTEGDKDKAKKCKITKKKLTVDAKPKKSKRKSDSLENSESEKETKDKAQKKKHKKKKHSSSENVSDVASKNRKKSADVASENLIIEVGIAEQSSGANIEQNDFASVNEAIAEAVDSSQQSSEHINKSVDNVNKKLDETRPNLIETEDTSPLEKPIENSAGTNKGSKFLETEINQDYNRHSEPLAKPGNVTEDANKGKLDVPCNENIAKAHSDNEMNSDQESLIVVDEIYSDQEIDVIQSCDSEDDFQTFNDVGHNLSLVNISNERVGNLDLGGFPDYSDFDVAYLQSNMSDDPAMWMVLTRDTLHITQQQKGPRCNRCRQFGHMALRCTNKPEFPACSLCGNPGHQEARCPNKICFQCGNAGAFTTTFCWRCVKLRKMQCTLCNTIGHVVDACPDLWRRYHLTVQEGPIIALQGHQLKPRNQQWCSGCAQQGHLEHECNSYSYNREYPAALPCIFEYFDVYNMRKDVPVVEAPSTSKKINPVSFNRSIFQLPNDSRIEVPVENQHQVLNPFSILNNPSQNDFSNAANSGLQNPNESALLPINENWFKMPETSNVLHNTDNNLSRNKQKDKSLNPVLRREVKHLNKIFNSSLLSQLQMFVRDELEQIDMLDRDPKIFKRKLYAADRTMQKKKLSRVDFEGLASTYKHLNMFIFGVHKFGDGKKNLDNLRNFLTLAPQIKLRKSKRLSLQSSYKYIFSTDRHNVNYHRFLNRIVHNQQRK